MTMATNEFPSPANARPVQMPAELKPATAPTPAPTTLAAAFRTLAGQESFTLDPDLRLALEDMAQAANGARWKECWAAWLTEMVNEGLRQMLGR